MRRSSGWEPRAFARQVFERAARKHWANVPALLTSALDPLKTNVCSHTVGVMVSSPSPTSRSGRRLGVWRGGRSGVVRALVRRVIARTIALGRPGPLGRTRELAEGGLRAGSSVPSKARPTLAGMNRTPHLERLAAPAKAVSRAGLVRRLRARLARSPGSPRGFLRARLARACDPLYRTTAARDARNTPKTQPLPLPFPSWNSKDTRDQQNHPMQHRYPLSEPLVNPTPNTPRPAHAPVRFDESHFPEDLAYTNVTEIAVARLSRHRYESEGIPVGSCGSPSEGTPRSGPATLPEGLPTAARRALSDGVPVMVDDTGAHLRYLAFRQRRTASR